MNDCKIEQISHGLWLSNSVSRNVFLPNAPLNFMVLFIIEQYQNSPCVPVTSTLLDISNEGAIKIISGD